LSRKAEQEELSRKAEQEELNRRAERRSAPATVRVEQERSEDEAESKERI